LADLNGDVRHDTHKGVVEGTPKAWREGGRSERERLTAYPREQAHKETVVEVAR
jgi:hypothetical protein